MADKRSAIAGYWRKLAKRERVIVIITLLCVLSGLLFRFPYSLLEKSLISMQVRIITTEKEILDLTTQLEELKRRAADGRGAATGWELADQKSALLFLEDVSSQARNLGVSLVAVHPAKEVEKEKYKELSMSLDLKGRYRQLGEYFKRLESLPKIVSVRKIRIESCPDSTSVCAAQVEAVTYMSK